MNQVALFWCIFRPVCEKLLFCSFASQLIRNLGHYLLLKTFSFLQSENSERFPDFHFFHLLHKSRFRGLTLRFHKIEQKFKVTRICPSESRIRWTLLKIENIYSTHFYELCSTGLICRPLNQHTITAQPLELTRASKDPIWKSGGYSVSMMSSSTDAVSAGWLTGEGWFVFRRFSRLPRRSPVREGPGTWGIGCLTRW